MYPRELDELGLNLEYIQSRDGSYVADILDSDEFGKVYSKLEKNDDVQELYDSSLVTVHNISVSYLFGDFQIDLIADFDQDQYKVIVTEYEYTDEDEEEIYFDDEEEDD